MKASRVVWSTICLASMVWSQTTEMNLPNVETGSGRIHQVTIGKALNQFVPNSLQAAVGDIIQFEFFPPNHSVVRAEYQQPCIPYEYTGVNKTGFFSGFFPLNKILSNPPTWNLTINDTEPIFLYCAAPGSCINQQMVAVINANSSESLATQQQDAAGSTYQLAPGDQFPSEDRGTPADATQPSTTGSKSMTAPSIPSTSSQSMTAPSITSTSSQSMANPTTLSTTSGPSSSSNNHSRISGGVIVGIVVAVIFVVGLIGALLFLIGRHKTLLQFTHRQRHAGHPGSYSSSNPMAETRMFSPSFHQSTKDSSNLYHFPSPPMKTRFSISEHPAFANSESTDPETGPGVPPYSPLALSPPLGRSPNHIAELAAQAENANGPGTIPRSSSRLSTSRTRSRSSDPLRQQPQQQIQRLSGQQPSNRRPELEKERKCQKEGPKEANSWQKSSSTRSQERDETSGYWSYDSNQHVEEDVCPAATNSSSDAEQAPDSPTLGSVRRR